MPFNADTLGRHEVDVNRGLSLEILWFDDDIVEYRVRGCNGNFAGATNLYAVHDGLARVADTFRGFPVSVDDQREIELGTFDPERAGGGARFRLRCIDNLGHANLSLRLRTDADEPDTAEFSVRVDAAGIDSVIDALGKMAVAVGAVAFLPEAT